jgi:hypothetical protein
MKRDRVKEEVKGIKKLDEEGYNYGKGQGFLFSYIKLMKRESVKEEA